jgi:hypothetical protein
VTGLESIIRQAMGGPGGSSAQADRRNAVKDALRQNGKTVGG